MNKLNPVHPESHSNGDTRGPASSVETNSTASEDSAFEDLAKTRSTSEGSDSGNIPEVEKVEIIPQQAGTKRKGPPPKYRVYGANCRKCKGKLRTRYPPSSMNLKVSHRTYEQAYTCHSCYEEMGMSYCARCNVYKSDDKFSTNKRPYCDQCLLHQSKKKSMAAAAKKAKSIAVPAPQYPSSGISKIPRSYLPPSTYLPYPMYPYWPLHPAYAAMLSMAGVPRP